MAPLPKFFSIWARAVSSAFFLSSGLTGPEETGADFSKEKYAYTTGNKVTIKNTSPIRLKLDITISAIQTKIYPDSKMEQFGIYYY